MTKVESNLSDVLIRQGTNSLLISVYFDKNQQSNKIDRIGNLLYPLRDKGVRVHLYENINPDEAWFHLEHVPDVTGLAETIKKAVLECEMCAEVEPYPVY